MKKKIKILRIQSRICIGGPAIHTSLLSYYLSQGEFETVLIGGASESDEFSKYKELKNRGIKIQLVGAMQRKTDAIKDFIALYKMYKIIQQEKPIIIHTHTAKAGTIGRIAALLAGVPLIFHTFHGHTFHSYFPWYLTAFFLFIERLLARFTTKIIAISPSQKHELVDVYRVAPANKVTVVRLGFELEPFATISHNGFLKEKLGIPADAYLLGIIGRLAPIKNMDMALRVLALLQHKNIHLIVVGDGTERAILEQRANQLGIAEKTHFWGWETDVAKIYSGIDMLLLTSKNEGTPVTIIEAMASRVPVVATRVGGVPDVIQHGESGFLCKLDDDKKMAEQITFLLESPSTLQQICNQARRSVLEIYTVQRLVRDIDRLYSQYFK